MKKFNRLLSMLLVVVMLAGLMTIVGAVDEPAAPAESAVTVKITYNGNGGTRSDNTTVTEKEYTYTVVPSTGTIPMSASWSKVVGEEEFVLVGWAASPNATEADFAVGNVAASAIIGKSSAEDENPGVYNVTLYAVWAAKEPAGNEGGQQPGEGTTPPAGEGTTPVTYTVKFDANGGEFVTAITDQSVEKGEKVGKPNVQVSREGFLFRGWHTMNEDGKLESEFAFDSTPITGDITLYAKWELVENETIPTYYTINFNANGGTGTMAGQTFTAGTAQALSANVFTKEGHEFAGWKVENKGDSVIADKASYTATANVTLYAQWTEKETTPPPSNPPAEPEIKEVSVSLSSIVDKKLVLKDNLPVRFNETFKAAVYAQKSPNSRIPGGIPGLRPGFGPGRPYPDGYVNYRNLEYVATVETSVAVMRHDPFFKYPVYYRIPDFRWNRTLTQDFVPVQGSDITELTFTEPGTYTYYVKELAGKTRHMSYDTDWKKVIITVTEVEGVLKASVKAATITNVYDKSANFDADANSSVTVTKVDSVDKTKVLQGAKFKLYQEGKYKDYEYYNTYTTNYNGEIEIYNLAPGDYYFIEVAAPVGYELDDSKIEFTIGKTAKTNDVELTVTNKKINVFTEEHFAYIQGYEDGTVRPQNNITRAEAATILFRLLNDNVRAQYWDTVSSYADVPVNAWYNNAVATLENMGVLEVGANYRPNDYITRAELVNMITKFYDMSGLDLEGVAITDVSGHVYETAIKQAAAMGWVKGYTDGSFNPDASITRAEAVTMINRVLERAVEERGMCAGMKTFPDNPVSAWYYEDVQEATNSHTYTRTTTLVDGYDFYYESWGSIQANPDWTALETTWAK